MLRSSWTALIVLCAAVGGVPTAAAEEPVAAGAREELDDLIRSGEEALATGRFDGAERHFRKALAGEGASVAAHHGLVTALLRTGRVAEALTAAEEAHRAVPSDGALAVLRGRLLGERGRLDEAEEALRGAVELDPSSARARTALGDHLRSRGRRTEALAAYVAANDLWANRKTDDPQDYLAVARARFAVFELDPEYRPQLQSTLRILGEAIEGGALEGHVDLAAAYTRNDQTELVPKTLKPLLQRDPLHADALVAAAEAKRARFETGTAAELAGKALRSDPTHPGAIEILALLALSDGHADRADELVSRGLAARPAHRALQSLAAARLYVTGDEAGWRAAVDAVLERDPTYGRAYDLLARVLEDRRRFAEAASMARLAVAVDPGDAEAWFGLARNLLNQGLEKEAREALEQSDATDPWRSLFRANFQRVLERLESYVDRPTEHFELRIHLDEDAALRPLYATALDDSFRVLRDRYGFTPEGPLVAEVFRTAEDFSARTLGIPGFGAVGACFGKVVTLDSPSAMPPGSYNWRSTLHHELAHVYTLQMSDGRVPRWFTEGMSVWEERRANPSWLRNMDRVLIDRLANGTVLGVEEIEGAFRGPLIGWAYYQGGLMLEWMEREYGFPKLTAMLRAWAKDARDRTVLRDVLGTTAEEFDAGFLQFCQDHVDGWRVRPRWDEERTRAFRRRSADDRNDLEAHLLHAEAMLQQGRTLDAGTALARARAIAPEDPHLIELLGRNRLATVQSPEPGLDLLAKAFAAGRDHFDLRFDLGVRAERAGDLEKALEHFTAARRWFPRATGPRDPRVRMEKLLIALGRIDESVAVLEERVAISETGHEERLRLAEHYAQEGRPEDAVRMLREALDILPLPARGWPAAEIHARLGRQLLAAGRPGEAADALRHAVIVGRTLEPLLEDRAVADLLVEQARAELAAGRPGAARAAAEDALRTVPDHDGARELLQDPAIKRD